VKKRDCLMKFKIRFLTVFEMTINTTPNHKKISVIQSAAKELIIFSDYIIKKKENETYFSIHIPADGFVRSAGSN